MKSYQDPGPREKKDRPNDPTGEQPTDRLESSSPTDDRSDEKVIVNEQRSNKAVNGPSQSAPHASEVEGVDEDIVN